MLCMICFLIGRMKWSNWYSAIQFISLEKNDSFSINTNQYLMRIFFLRLNILKKPICENSLMYNIKRNYRLLLSINNNLSKQYVKQLFSLLPRLWIAMNILMLPNNINILINNLQLHYILHQSTEYLQKL